MPSFQFVPSVRVLASLAALAFALPALAVDRLVPSQYATIQAAIDAAVNGDRVLVSPGTYQQRIDLKGKAITLKSAGNSSNTFLSTNGTAGAVISCITGETTACVIEGFHVYGGIGPGIAITSASPTINACVFSGNGGSAAAVAIVSGSPKFDECVISGNTNTGTNGGAVSFTGTGGTVRFEDCDFSGNFASGRDGGAIAASSNGGSLVLVRCDFLGNQSTGSVGGAISSNGVALTLEACTFTSNKVTATDGDRHGGAIYTNATILATSCVFQSNSVIVATSGAGCNSGDRQARGGAISAAAQVSLLDCEFIGNIAEAPNGWYGYCGGWPYGASGRSWGGALFLSSANGVAVTVSDSAFNSNISRCVGGSHQDARGGAIAMVNGCSPVIRRSTFTNNSAAAPTNIGSYGGSLFYEGGGSFGSVEDCVFTGSKCNSEGGAIYLATGAKPFVLRCTFSGCMTLLNGSIGGAVRAVGGANATLSTCLFENCSTGTGGAGAALCTHNSQVFVLGSNFKTNTSSNGSAIHSQTTGLTNIPHVSNSYFCGNSGPSTNWITGQWHDSIPGSNAFLATCGNDCNQNGIPDATEIAGGASDCDTDGVLDSCQLASADRNNDGVYDPCQSLAFERLEVEIKPVVGSISGLPSTAVCWRVYAKLSAANASVTGIFGDTADPLSIQATGGFFQSPSGGNVASDIPCTGGGPTVAYDSYLTVGGECANEVDVIVTGIDFTAFNADGGISSSNGIAFVTPGAPASLAGKDRRVLLMQLTSKTGVKPTTSFNLIGDNADGTEWFAYALPLPNPTLVDCNANGTHDALDISTGTSRDCNRSGVPDECEYANANADCDADGTVDLCEIFAGAEIDLNNNGIPDDCECLGDVTGDNAVNVYDVIAVIVAWGDPNPGAADLNGDGVANGVDLSLVLTGWGYCL